MADLTPIVCTTGPDLTKVDCDGTLVISGETIPAPDPITPPIVEDGIVPDNPTTDVAHDPPAPSHDPFPTIVGIVAGEAGTDSPSEFAVTAIDDAGDMSGVPATYKFSAWTNGTRVNVSNLAVSSDGLHAWHLSLGSVNSVYEWWLVHWDLTNPFAPTKSYEYNIFDDTGKAHSGLARLSCFGTFFYSDKTQRLYILYHGTDDLDVGMLIYDVSTPASDPTLISHTASIQTGTFANYRGFEMAEDELHCWYGEDTSVPSNSCRMRCLVISADGTSVALTGSTLVLDGTGRPSHAINMRLVNSDVLLVSWGTSGVSGQNAFVTVDISTPGSETVLDSINFNTVYTGGTDDPRSQTIGVNTLNTRAYQYIYSIGGTAAIVIIDISDPSALSIVTYFNRGATSIPDTLGAGLSYIENDTGAQFLIMIGLETWDVSDENNIVQIDNGGSANKNTVIAHPNGPKTFRIHADTTALPVPVDANLAVVTGQKSGRGVAVVVGLDDYTAPEVQATIREVDLFGVYGPYTAFLYDGSYLCILGPNTGTLQVYSTGALLALVGSLQDNSLIGARGLVNKSDETSVYTVIGAGTSTISLVKLDISTPAAPTIDAITDIGPNYYDGDGDYPSIVGQTDLHWQLQQNGPSLVSKSGSARTGDAFPIELRNSTVVAIDGTYAYVWNDYNGGGLAVIDYTADTLDLIGYLHVGTRTYNADQAIDIVKSGNYVYILHTRSPNALTAINVTTPSAPTLADELEVGDFPVEMSLRSATELVVFGQTTLYRVDITTPTALVVTASLATGHFLLAGAVSNEKAVAFDNTGMAYSYSLGSPIVEEDSLDVSANGDGGAEAFSFASRDYVAVLHRGGLGVTPRLIVVEVTTVSALALTSYVEWPGQHQFWALDATTRRGVIFDYQTGGDLVFAGYKGINLFNPTAPALYSRAYVAEATELDRNPIFVAINGNDIVIGRGDTEGGLVVGDVSDLSDPSVVRWLGDLTVARFSSRGRTHYIRGSSTGIAVGYTPRFRVHSVLMDAEPRIGDYTQLLPNSLVLGAQATAISDDGNYLFVGYKEQGELDSTYAVRVYDVSDPTAAFLLSSYTVGRAIQSIKVSGQSMTIFVTHGNVNQSPAMMILDFTDPYNPALTGEVDIAADEWVAQALETY